ncbi:hypothetical protein PWT90_00194 [Aphanocladium album]|nr:hypothetical protein PWT90_00194 [Aphanocladium album]
MRNATCTACQGIWKACTGTAAAFSNHLIRSSQSASLPQFPVHTPLLYSCTGFLRDNLDEDIKPLAGEADVRIQGGVRNQSALHPGRCRVFDSEWADLEGIKACKDKCLATCGNKCENPLKMGKETPDKLIYVEKQCMVTGEEGVKAYVALSYVLGDAGQQVTSQTQQSLRTPGSLTEVRHISTVIINAMEVTKRLEERYLWADALCIPRDTHPRRMRQLQMMGTIYANAVVTIVATNGDANDALGGVTTPRTMKQTVVLFGEESLIIRDNGPLNKMQRRSEYYERGWMRQEHMLARRTVTFGNGQVSWKCQNGHWYEELPLFSGIDREAEDTGLGDMMLGFPRVDMLADVLTAYNQNRLRFEEDAHPAISGLLSVLSRSFPGGLLYGLPGGLFDWALGWSAAQPAWFGLEDESAEKRRRIRSTWFENRVKNEDATTTLPPGWLQHGEETLRFADGSKLLNLDGFHGCNYTHEALRDADGGHHVFYYVILVEEVSGKTQPVIPEQMPHLFCRTKKALVCVRRDEGEQWDKKRVDLCHDDGRGIAFLMPHNSSHLEQLMERDGRRVALVVVNRQIRCSKKNRTQATNGEDATEERKTREQEEDADQVEKKETCTVPWVEWTDGVASRLAYRLASGSVDAAAWERLELEDVDLNLG